MKIKNIDTDENKGYIFQISVLTQPALPKDYFDPSKNLIFIIGNGGGNQIGYLEEEVFIEIVNSEFISGLEVNVLEVLTIAGDSGHFKS
ncbi:hypothetical protein [Mucilaginibacter sp.]|uniref:hypothetical protein n=1 Tax=Mucilaginibacter sp. TaxID=1882438 RepID=UPI003D0B4875